MSGLIRVRWVANGLTVKDETIPHTYAAIDGIGDGVEIEVMGETIKLEVEFTFDPPPTCPAAVA